MAFPSPSEKQARILWMSLTALGIGVLLGLLGLLVWGLGLVLQVLAPVIWPVAIAGILAYLLDPLVDFLEQRKVSRGRAILLVFLLGVLAVGGIFASVVPRLVYETSNLIADVPAYTRQVQTNVTDWISTKSPWQIRKIFSSQSIATQTLPGTNVVPAEPGVPTVAPPDAPPPKAREPGWEKKITESAISWLAAFLPKFGSWILAQLSHVASWAGFMIGLVMVPVFAYYFLQEKKGIQEGWTHYLPVQESAFKEELVFVLNSINNYLIVFFRGQVLIALCNGVLLTIGFLSMGLNYAVLIGVAAGLLGIVPYLGTIMTIIPATVVAAVQFRDWLHPLVVVGIFSVVHLIEGFVVSPKIMGDRVGLHPLTIIIAVLVGTTLLGGILGGILAIPLTAALRVVMFRYVWKRREA